MARRDASGYISEDEDSGTLVMEPRDASGHILQDGDSVTLAKDLKVKGMPKVLKRGETLKNIKVESDTSIECKIGKSTISVIAAFVKKKK